MKLKIAKEKEVEFLVFIPEDEVDLFDLGALSEKILKADFLDNQGNSVWQLDYAKPEVCQPEGRCIEAIKINIEVIKNILINYPWI